jgi:hypothetical protein
MEIVIARIASFIDLSNSIPSNDRKPSAYSFSVTMNNILSIVEAFRSVLSIFERFF